MPQIQAASGLNAVICQNALDILEAVLFAAPSAPARGRLSARYCPLFHVITPDFFGLIIGIGLWAGLIGLEISIALIAAQIFYLKKKFAARPLITSALRGIAAGAASGALAQFIYNFTQHISPTVQVTSRVICWGIFGWGLGCVQY